MTTSPPDRQHPLRTGTRPAPEGQGPDAPTGPAPTADAAGPVPTGDAAPAGPAPTGDADAAAPTPTGDADADARPVPEGEGQGQGPGHGLDVAADAPATRPPLRRVNPAELSPPTGFSHAVTATGARLVFLAGQTALDGAGRVVEGPLPEQFERALSNLLTALRAAGGRPEHLARVTVYATDVADYRTQAPELGRIWRKLAGRDYPAMAVVGVVRLWDEQALVELDGIALLP